MIRTYKEQDLTAVMQLWLSANIDAHSFIPADYWKSQYETVKRLIPQADVYLFETEGIINGFIGIVDAYIAGIFVNKNERSAGIGTALLNVAKANQDKLQLSVFTKNEAAIRFYLNAGFQMEENHIDTATKEEEYLMIWKR